MAAEHEDIVMERLDASRIRELARLEQACFSSPWTAGDFEKAMESPHFSVFGALRQERIEAYVSIRHALGEMEILNIATRAECRRQGLARALLANMVSLMPRLNVEAVFLEVRETNTPARNLYESIGFRQVGLRKKYYQDTGEDALVMALEYSRQMDS